jgi:hypothetical protein
LETARLDTLALLRALDRAMIPLPQLPHAELHQLYQLDADCAEALWALEQPAGSLDFAAMVRDTLASLQQLPAARDIVRTRVPLRPGWRNLNRTSAPNLIRARPTTTSLAIPPKTVKHPG